VYTAAVLILLLALPYVASPQAGQEQSEQGYIPVAFVYIGNNTLSSVVTEQKITLEPLEAVICNDIIVVVYGFNSSTPYLVALYAKGNVTSLATVEKCLLQARSKLEGIIGVKLADSAHKMLVAYTSLLIKMEAARELPAAPLSSLEDSATALVVTVPSPTPTLPTTPATKAEGAKQVATGVCSAEVVVAERSSQRECVVSSTATTMPRESQEGLVEAHTKAAVRATSLTSGANTVSRPGDYERLAIVLLPSLAVAGLVALLWRKKIG
jgi:hypothetical protein